MSTEIKIYMIDNAYINSLKSSTYNKSVLHNIKDNKYNARKNVSRPYIGPFSDGGYKYYIPLTSKCMIDNTTKTEGFGFRIIGDKNDVSSMSGLCIANSLLNVPEEFLREYNETYVTEKHRNRYSYQISWLEDVNNNSSAKRKQVENSIYNIASLKPWNSLKGLSNENKLTLLHCMNLDKLKEIYSRNNEKKAVSSNDNIFQVLADDNIFQVLADDNSNTTVSDSEVTTEIVNNLTNTNTINSPSTSEAKVKTGKPKGNGGRSKASKDKSDMASRNTVTDRIKNNMPATTTAGVASNTQTTTPKKKLPEPNVFDNLTKEFSNITTSKKLIEKIKDADDVITTHLLNTSNASNSEELLYSIDAICNSFRMYSLYSNLILKRSTPTEIAGLSLNVTSVLSQASKVYNYVNNKTDNIKLIENDSLNAIKGVNKAFEIGIEKINGWEEIELVPNSENLFFNALKRLEKIKCDIFCNVGISDEMSDEISYLKRFIQAVSDNLDNISRANRKAVTCINDIKNLKTEIDPENKDILKWLDSVKDIYIKQFPEYLRSSNVLSNGGGIIEGKKLKDANLEALNNAYSRYQGKIGGNTNKSIIEHLIKLTEPYRTQMKSDKENFGTLPKYYENYNHYNNILNHCCKKILELNNQPLKNIIKNLPKKGFVPTEVKNWAELQKEREVHDSILENIKNNSRYYYNQVKNLLTMDNIGYYYNKAKNLLTIRAISTPPTPNTEPNDSRTPNSTNHPGSNPQRQ